MYLWAVECFLKNKKVKFKEKKKKVTLPKWKGFNNTEDLFPHPLKKNAKPVENMGLILWSFSSPVPAQGGPFSFSEANGLHFVSFLKRISVTSQLLLRKTFLDVSFKPNHMCSCSICLRQQDSCICNYFYHQPKLFFAHENISHTIPFQ